MLILGLLLLACTAAFTGLAISDNLSGGPDYTVSVLGNPVATMNSLAVFCAGLALAVLFGLGALMTMRGLGLRLRRRRIRTPARARHDAALRARERDEPASRPDNPATTGAPVQEYAAPGDHGDTRDRDLAAGRDAGGVSRDSGATRAPRHRHRHARHLFGH